MCACGRDLSALARAWSSLTRFAAPVMFSLRAMGSVMREVSRTTSASLASPNARTSKSVDARRSPESMTCTGLRDLVEKEAGGGPSLTSPWARLLRRVVGRVHIGSLSHPTHSCFKTDTNTSVPTQCIAQRGVRSMILRSDTSKLIGQDHRRIVSREYADTLMIALGRYVDRFPCRGARIV